MTTEHRILIEAHGWGDDGRAFCSCGWHMDYDLDHMEHRAPGGTISYVFGVDVDKVLADHAAATATNS